MRIARISMGKQAPQRPAGPGRPLSHGNSGDSARFYLKACYRTTNFPLPVEALDPPNTENDVIRCDITKIR